MTIGCRYLISTLKVFAFSFIIIFYVFSSFICKIWRHRADFANWWKVLDAFISGVQGIKLIGKTVSDESYTLWFHVSSKVNTFTQIRTALVGRPYRENECIGNCREFKGISKNCSSRPLSEQYFSDTIHWQNTNSSNLSNNWLVTIHPRNRTYTQKLSKNINFWEPPNKHNPLLGCNSSFIAEKSACWDAKWLSFEKYDNCWFAFILAGSIHTFSVFSCFWRFEKVEFSGMFVS